jgi:platelet-activating factor acetylhydrolase IB subunit alpha
VSRPPARPPACPPAAALLLAPILITVTHAIAYRSYCLSTIATNSEWVRAIAVSPDGASVAIGSADHVRSLASPASPASPRSLTRPRAHTSVQTAAVWALSSSALVATLRGHEHVVESVAFSGAHVDKAVRAAHAASRAAAGASDSAPPSAASGQEVAGCFVATASRDRTVRLWSLPSGTCVAVMSDHDNWVRGVVFHPSLPLLISCSDDKTIRVW